ncbi:MAPEG family protein [Pseudomonadota bacterium]
MSFNPILMPLLAMVSLTFLVWVYLYALRIPEIKLRKINLDDLRDRAEAHKLLTTSAAASNNLKNLFEMPILFYVAVMLAVLLLIQDALLVRLAWGFVIMRVIHSAVHCSYNRVMHRFLAYFISCLFLLLLWLRLASYLIMN